MYLGVDLGTSAIKVVITDIQGHIVDTESCPLSVSRPQPLWSEQDPTEWRSAFYKALDALSIRNHLASVSAIGLSGQMHGAVLLDDSGSIIRPAILWNDGRSDAECKQLESWVPNSREITGNMMMPGFTAPKLVWLREYEPENFKRIAKVLLPKDYLRFVLSGDFASDMSDSAGTLWLNTAERAWDQSLLDVCGLNINQMPSLFEGSQVTGQLHSELAMRWGLNTVPIVAGGGDNAAGAIGVGLINPGQGMLSLGTSGVYFLVTDEYSQKADLAVHSFCHAIPERWHLMSVLLSAASCLQWFADHVARQDVSSLLAQLESVPTDSLKQLTAKAPLFLPYLSGERTPHNNPKLQGSWVGLTHDTDILTLLHSVLEGVSLAFADGVDALHQSGAIADEITVIGGGARSAYWRQMLADVLNLKIIYRDGGDIGPALGAARLAKIAMQPKQEISEVCPQPRVIDTHLPNPIAHKHYQQRRKKFVRLFSNLNTFFD